MWWHICERQSFGKASPAYCLTFVSSGLRHADNLYLVDVGSVDPSNCKEVSLATHRYNPQQLLCPSVRYYKITSAACKKCPVKP
jgi:hypothetical protein